MKIITRVIVITLVFGAPVLAQVEPTVFICGIWPNKILFFDQTTDRFTDALQLNHGAVTNAAYTSDKSRFFVVTDRMESVEVIDPVRRAVIDEFKLSTENRRVRIFGVFPNREGTKAYITFSATEIKSDRFVRNEEADVVLYDLRKKKIVDQFKIPDEVAVTGRPRIHISPEEKSIFFIGRDIYEMDAETHEVVDKLEMSKPILSGYGPFRGGLSLTETQPGIFYGIYRTVDPFQNKKMFGIAKLDLYEKQITSFELGPQLRLGRFALSADGKRGYAGLHDMVVVDMETKKVLLKKEGFERGRTNISMIVSYDGTKLYVSGVGDTMWVYDANSLEEITSVFAGGDFMMPPVEIPNPKTSASH